MRSAKVAKRRFAGCLLEQLASHNEKVKSVIRDDLRNIYRPEHAREAGLAYVSVGRPDGVLDGGGTGIEALTVARR